MKWRREWLAVDEQGKRRVPAYDWLKDQPLNIRKQLLAIVEAVSYSGPDPWMDRTSHCPMRDDLDHVHEARDKHGETLYRLFLRWHRDEKRVVLLDGRTKPNNTALPDKEYKKIEALADKADADDPDFATFDDFAETELLPEPDKEKDKKK